MARLPNLGLDAYTRRARLQPALLVLLPLLLAYGAWFPQHARLEMLPFAGVIYLVLSGLLAQVARDRGRRLEPELIRRWGGLPTTQLLRHRNKSVNPTTRERHHARLAALMPDIRLPSAAEELGQPEAADQTYDACVARLREHTRAREEFPLVFEENANYGYRRNVWAMRPLGLSLAALGLATTIALAIGQVRTTGAASGLSIATSALNALLLALWVIQFSDGWVRIAAEAYARQLLAACERLKE